MPDNVFYGVTLPVYTPDAATEEFEALLNEYANFTFTQPQNNELAVTESDGKVA